MKLTDLARRDVSTSAGVIQIYARPNFSATKPVVLAIGGTFAMPDELASLPDSLGMLFDACIMPMPGATGPVSGAGFIAAVAKAVGEIIEGPFRDRPVVLLGVSLGAIVALRTQASNLKRLVLLDPPLTTGELWPIVEPLRAHLKSRPDDAALRAFVFEIYGVGDAALEPRSYLPMIEALQTPTDVVLGSRPLQPQRALERFPSLVGEQARRLLAASPQVRLHVAPDTGHNVMGQAPKVVQAVLMEACRRAAASDSFDGRGLDEPLVEATPLTARRVLHWGPGGRAFEAAFRAWNPGCELTVLGEDAAPVLPAAGDPFDVAVCGAPPPASLLGRLAAALREDGHLVARWAEAALGERTDALARSGLVGREPVDRGGTGVVRAQKLAPGERPEPAMHVSLAAYASLLMDIRTRLPARGLASDPAMQVVYVTPPFVFPKLAPDTPKVAVFQRPAEKDPAAWLPIMTWLVRQGWLAVLEYDDHPLLIAEVMGRPAHRDEMLRLGFFHAVQTATPALVEAFRPFNPHLALFPNTVFDLPPFPDQAGRPLKVMYGALVRGRFAVEVAASLGPAIARRPDAEFLVIGDRAVFDALPTQAKRYYDYMTYEAYLGLMAQCDISLSPIEALPMRETKSDAKYLDAARCGAMTIGSPILYERTIRHGVNGMLAATVADWAPMLGEALADPDLRGRLARGAWTDVRDHRMFAGQVAQRRDWYRQLWDQRHDLNEGLMQRLPGLREALEGKGAAP